MIQTRYSLALLIVIALSVCVSGCVKADESMRGAFAVPDDLSGGITRPIKPVVLPSRWDPEALPISEVTDDWLLLVNKTHPLSPDYKPHDLVRIRFLVGDHAESMRYMRSEAAEQFHAMAEAAAAAGHEIGIRTAYRSYAQQRDIFWSYVARDGEAAANKYSARPGESEHQSGLCADVSSPSVGYRMTTDYGKAPEGMWLAQNAHRFGFIVRYPLGKEHITGYQYEPWHVRYVGREPAGEMYELDLTLEEYLGEID